MPPPLRPAGVVDVAEAVGQGLHVPGAQCHPRHSMLQPGVETEGAEPGPRRAGQRQREQPLRTLVGDVALPLAGEAPREPRLDPVRGAAGGPVEAGRIHEGLQDQDPWPKRAGQSQTMRQMHGDRTRESMLRGVPGRIRNRELSGTRCRRPDRRLRFRPIRRSRAPTWAPGPGTPLGQQRSR